MFLVAKLITTVDSVLTRLAQKEKASSPMTKERILSLLGDIREVGFQTWTHYHAEEKDGAVEHFIASDSLWVQANVYESAAQLHIFSRETSHILAERRYRWRGRRADAPVLSCVWVTDEEFQYLKTLGASEQLLPDAASRFFGSMLDWVGHSEYVTHATRFFGTVERAEELTQQMFDAARHRLGITFEL
jgi:hypothetical protein